MQWLFRFFQKPFQTYLNIGKNLLKFLSGTEELTICYNYKGLTNGLQFIRYYDSDFTGDKESFKSTYDYIFKFTGDSINWKSKKVSTVTLSTLKAKTDALIKDIRKVSWIIGLFKKLKRSISRPIVFYNDNQNVITIVYNPTLHSRTKHMLLKYHYIRK